MAGRKPPTRQLSCWLSIGKRETVKVTFITEATVNNTGVADASRFSASFRNCYVNSSTSATHTVSLREMLAIGMV
jgi:hypothetical protein